MTHLAEAPPPSSKSLLLFFLVFISCTFGFSDVLDWTFSPLARRLSMFFRVNIYFFFFASRTLAGDETPAPHPSCVWVVMSQVCVCVCVHSYIKPARGRPVIRRDLYQSRYTAIPFVCVCVYSYPVIKSLIYFIIILLHYHEK